MNVTNAFEWKRAKVKRDKLHKLLLELDKVGDVLYNNIEHGGVWEIIKKYEEVRINYYVEFYEWDQIVKQRKTNGQKIK